MKKTMLNVILIICVYALSLSLYADHQADKNHTLHVYVTNASQDSLHFERVIGTNPGNKFTINPKIINPGEHTIITVEKQKNNDIFGYVIFSTTEKIEARILILDQEQVHFGQPIFSVYGPKHYSILISKTRNENVGPRYLTYLEAALRIINNPIKQN
ncbi:MAG: hypothetical protein KIT56_05155 [Gammaproteobacteria bacterium]|nr:hypothetical protein [Gammaproteobacteria bacterium]MCW5583262.1 hypothetical protein [Gammaproteobacteria bacterium]